MILRLVSDIHLEFDKHGKPSVDLNELLKGDYDVAIFAGDIATKLNFRRWKGFEKLVKPTIMIAGNHEFYGETFPDLIPKLKTEASKFENLHFLENEELLINNTPFFGGTMWTGFDGAPGVEKGIAMAIAQSGMNDFKKITCHTSKGYTKLKPHILANYHVEAISKLQSFLEKYKSDSVVVTHHAPSIQSSIVSGFANDPINAAYSANCESLINRYQPRLWVHGHIHNSVDYYLGDTHILSNPHGYIDVKNPKFKPDFNISVTSELKMPKQENILLYQAKVV